MKKNLVATCGGSVLAAALLVNFQFLHARIHLFLRLDLKLKLCLEYKSSLFLCSYKLRNDFELEEVVK